MTLEEKIERLREDIRRISQYGNWELEVQVLDSKHIAVIRETLTTRELLFIGGFKVVRETPTEFVAQQVLELPKRTLKITKAAPEQPLPPVHRRATDKQAEKARAAAVSPTAKSLRIMEDFLGISHSTRYLP